MKKELLTLSMMAMLSFSTDALACSNAKNLINKNILQSSIKDSIDREDINPKKEVNYTTVRANNICSFLSEKAEAQIIVVDRKIAKIDILSNENSNKILKSLEKEWGKAIRKPNQKQSQVKTFQNLWSSEGKIVFYSNDKNTERFSVSSSFFQKKIAEDKIKNETSEKGGLLR